jgi:hypothetical protein
MSVPSSPIRVLVAEAGGGAALPAPASPGRLPRGRRHRHVGYRDMRHDGYKKALRGFTTLEEIIETTMPEAE